MRQDGERVLERKIMAVTSRIEKVMKRDFGVKWFRLKKEDEVRLLRIAQWEEKYKVPVEWILYQLIPLWRGRQSRQFAVAAQAGNKGFGQLFGTKVATLVGQKSEEILREKIAQQFPEHEQIDRWKATEQEKQIRAIREMEGLGNRAVHLNWSDPADIAESLRQYRKKMGRERITRMKLQKDLRKKSYRGNPWL